MYQGNAATVDELVARAQEIRDAQHDFRCDSRTLRFGVAERSSAKERGHLTVSVVDPKGISFGPYHLTQHATGQLCEHQAVSIPAKFMNGLLDSPACDALAYAVPSYLSTALPDTRYVRCLDAVDGTGVSTPTCRAFLTASYRVWDNSDIIEHAIAPVMREHPDVEAMSAHLDFDRMMLKLVSKTLREEIVPGSDDWVFAGVRIENSETGLGALNLEPFVYRLVCKNGLTANLPGVPKLRKVHLGKRVLAGDELVRHLYADDTLLAESMTTFLQFRDVARHILSPKGFAEVVQSMRSAAEQPYTADPQAAVDTLAEVFALTEAERVLITSNAFAEERTRWGLVNAVTAAAEAAPDYNRADQLEALGGELLQLPAAKWGKIAVAEQKYGRTIRLGSSRSN